MSSTPRAMDEVSRSRDVTLVELLDRLLDKGVVLAGDLTISVAGVDLVDLSLRVLLCSTEAAQREGVPVPSATDALSKDAFGSRALHARALHSSALDKSALDKDALDKDALDKDALDKDALDKDALDPQANQPGGGNAGSGSFGSGAPGTGMLGASPEEERER